MILRLTRVELEFDFNLEVGCSRDLVNRAEL